MTKSSPCLKICCRFSVQSFFPYFLLKKECVWFLQICIKANCTTCWDISCFWLIALRMPCFCKIWWWGMIIQELVCEEKDIKVNLVLTRSQWREANMGDYGRICEILAELTLVNLLTGKHTNIIFLLNIPKRWRGWVCNTLPNLASET